MSTTDPQIPADQPHSGPDSARRRKPRPAAPKIAVNGIFTATHRGTTQWQGFYNCPKCAGTHKVHSTGLRVTACGRGLVDLVDVAGGGR